MRWFFARLHCAQRLALSIMLGLILLPALPARGQGPQVDVNNPPGAPTARGRLGAALGASGTSGFDASPVTTQQSIFGGRPGPSATRAPINQLGAPEPAVMRIQPIVRPTPLAPADVPRYGELDLPLQDTEEGPANGLTLDAAIVRLLQNNLNLLSLKYEIPMAEADVLTASLRNNPIFYADSQLVPYGHFSNQRPGGDTQYDVNMTQPIDVWRKRKARTLVALRAKRVTEAQFQDAVRLQIDNLYTAYVDVVASRLTLRFSEVHADRLKSLHSLTELLFKRGQKPESDVLVVYSQLQLAELQVREASQAHLKTLRTLGRLLDIHPREADAVKLRSKILDIRPLPTTEDALIETALNARPDLLAYRYGLLRAEADITNARAQRYSDVYLLWQPYTFQNNNWQGLKSAYSFAFGVTVALPIFNRNQGNILRARLNADQSKVELANQEKQIIYDVQEAVREYQLSQTSVLEFRREVIPASKKVLELAQRRWVGGETSIIDFFEAQQDYNDVIAKYRDALVRHRNAMLDLNTAVGNRVVP
jgi:cobalt-zinc-cadmium efflux system outer membrane protein